MYVLCMLMSISSGNHTVRTMSQQSSRGESFNTKEKLFVVPKHKGDCKTFRSRRGVASDLKFLNISFQIEY